MLLLVRKLIVDNTLLNKLQLRLYRQEIHQIPVLYRLCQLITVSRHALLQLKNAVGIFIDLIFRRRSKTNKRCIKICENVFVFIVDRTMCLITDHKVKMAARK